MNAWIQIFTALLGAYGFAMIYGVRPKYCLAAGIGGMLAWAVYLAANAWLGSMFLSCLAAALFAMLYAELLARWLRLPTTLFIVPAIIPLVPGSTLYYAMSEVVRGNIGKSKDYGYETLVVALAIAAGLSFFIAIRELRTKK